MNLPIKMVNVFNERINEFGIESNLTRPPPKIMTFVLQFKSYFKKLEDDNYDENCKFETRPAFS